VININTIPENTEPQKVRGYEWEKIVFGRSSEHCEIPPYIKWERAINEVQYRQWEREWDPSNPKTPIARELFECIKTYLHPEAAAQLRFYCALGFELDLYHSIDGFFKIGRYLVCLDLTTNKIKSERRNVILFKPEDAGSNLWRIAKKIADTFNDEFSAPPKKLRKHQT